jgi:hypothetical protein
MDAPGVVGLHRAATPEGVLFGRGGRVYLATESGTEALATGYLVGAVGSSVLIFTCDDDASSCGIDLRTTSGTLIRRLAVEDWLPDAGWRVSSAKDGHFALVTAPASGPTAAPDATVVPDATITLFEPGGKTIATIRVRGSMSEGAIWLPDGAGLVGARNNRIVWIHQTGDGWVVEAIPGLSSISSVGLVHVNAQ